MFSREEIAILGDVLASVYRNPRTEAVKVPSPKPYEVSLEQEVLETRTVNGVERKVPKKETIAVTIGAEDYPMKKVTVSTVRERERKIDEKKDLGPKSDYIVYSAVIWLIGLIFLFAALAGRSGLWAPAILSFVVGAIVFSALKQSRRNVKVTTKIVKEWETVPKVVEIRVKEEYAPKTEQRPIPNTERVTALGQIAVQFEAVPVRSGSLLVDGYDLFKHPRLDFPVLSRGERVREAMERLEATIKELPAILSGGRDDVPLEIESPFRDGIALRGEEREILKLFGEMENLYRDVKVHTFAPNAIPPHHPLTRFLQPLPHEDKSPSMTNPELAKLLSVMEQEEAYDVEAIAERFVEVWRQNNLVMSGVRFESLHNQVAPLMIEFGHVSHYSSFNFYCPHCHKQAIESMLKRDYSISSGIETPPIYFSRNSHCMYDSDQKVWRCPTCEAVIEHPTSLIPVHKILDDVLFPAYDRLMEENKKARFDLDNSTKDAEMSYTNKMNQEMDDLTHTFVRDKGSTQSSIELMQAEMQGELHAIEAIRGILQLYELDQSAALGDIQRNSKMVQERIERDTAETLSRLDASFTRMMQSYETEMSELSRSKRQEDMIRDAIQVAILENAVRQTEHLATIEEHTGRTAEYTRQTAENTKDIAASSRQVARNTAQSLRLQEESNAISAALAKKQGADIHDHAFWRLDKSIPKLGSNLVSSLTGESSVERAKRQARAVR